MTILQIVVAVVLIESVLFYAYQTKKRRISSNSTTESMRHERYYRTRIQRRRRTLQEFDAADEHWADQQKREENFRSRMLRYGFNLFPPFRSSGAWLTHISADVRHVRLKIPLKLKTRNYVGTLCGGNMYSAIDGVYMVMLIKNLGHAYLVWDKAATIRYKKPAKGTLFVDFRLTEGELQEIKHEVARRGKVDREYLIRLVDESDTVCAEVTKTIHIKQKVA